MALDKGQFRSTDHVNDKHLAPHGFHEPSRLEHPDILRLNCRQLCTAVMSSKIVEENAIGYEHGAEYEIHENVGHKVEDGAGRPNPDHKASHAGRIPFPGLCDKLLVCVIPGKARVVSALRENGHTVGFLGDGINDILDQNFSYRIVRLAPHSDLCYDIPKMQAKPQKYIAGNWQQKEVTTWKRNTFKQN